jgi:diguanylate cyclase (GGDEF)-like protein/PAS domain S-box-containing protein
VRKRAACAALFSNTGNARVELVERLEEQISEESAVGHTDGAPEPLQVDAADQRYRWLMDHSPVAIGVHQDGRYVYVNETLVRRMAAQSADQFIGRLATDFVHPDSLPAVHGRVASRQQGDTSLPPLELVIMPFDGTTREVEAIASWTEWEGKPAHHVIFRDLTTQKAVEESLRFQAALVTHASDAIIATTVTGAEQHFETVVTSLEEGVIVIAADGAVESVNPAALRILGVSTTGIDGVELAKVATVPVYDADGQLLSSDQRPVLETLTRSPRRGCIYGVDRLGDGRRIWVSVNWSLLDPADPSRSSVLVSFTDITEQQATHDLVTVLPNRAHLIALITDAITADEQRLGAVLFIDMDKFKSVNEALGHHAGDTVLQIAAQRLRRAVRLDDVVGRVGGDEFVALLAAPIASSDVEDVANRLHAALEEPITIEDESDCARTNCTRVSASIGVVTVGPNERRGAVEILRDADLAMYQAKTTGKATSHFSELFTR